MKPAFHYTLGRGNETWREQIALAAEAGFTAIDLDIRDAARMDAAEVTGLLGGLQPATGRLPVYPGQRLDPAVALFCRKVGIRVLTCSVRPSLPEAADLLPEYQTWAKMLADEGLQLAIEALTPLHLREEHPFPYIQSLPQLLDFIHATGPNAGLLFDTWHWTHGELGAVNVPLDLPVLHVHLADAPDLPAHLIRDNERLFPGEGTVDLPALLRAIPHYDGFVAPEVFGQSDRFPTALARARHGLETTRAILKEVAV